MFNLSCLFKNALQLSSASTKRNLSTLINVNKSFNLLNLKSIAFNEQYQTTNLLKQQQSLIQQQQLRYNWGYKGRMMLKDIKRREIVSKFAPVRNRLQALRANSILPKVLKKDAQEELQQFPRDSSILYINNRCGFTSKVGGCLHKWRLSRIVWRDQVDYNHMSGITRSVWGRPTRNSAMFTYKQDKRNWFNYDGIKEIKVLKKNGSEKKYRFKLI